MEQEIKLREEYRKYKFNFPLENILDRALLCYGQLKPNSSQFTNQRLYLGPLHFSSLELSNINMHSVQNTLL